MAKDAEQEVRELIKDAETRNVLEIVAAYGLLDILMADAQDNPPDDEPKTPESEPSDHEDDIPPRQKRLWD